jgi:hypothetical protein
MVDEKNGGVTSYNETEAYAEAGHHGATVVSPGFKSSYVVAYLSIGPTLQFDRPDPYPVAPPFISSTMVNS